MAKKQNIYDGVSYDKLRNEIKDIINYLAIEDISKIEDSIDYKQNQKGGVTPMVTVKIEEKIETQLMTIESCCKILKSILDKEGLSPFVKLGIESLTKKLNDIQIYYEARPITSIKDRKLDLKFGKNTINVLVQSKESQVKYRTKISEKIYKIIPLINELESLKESIQVKGGYEIPLRMRIKREQNNG